MDEDTQDTMEGGYSLVLSFAGLYPTMAEEHAFCHGVEFAGLYHKMREGQSAEIDATTHPENRTIIERAAAKEGWDVEFKPSLVEGWEHTKLTKRRPVRDNPHGLRVVG